MFPFLLLFMILLPACGEDAPSNATPPEPEFVTPPDTVNSLAVGPSGIIYACAISGLYLSTDNGMKWYSGGQAVSGRDIYCAIETPAGALYAGSGGCTQPVGIMRSLDGGTHWTRADNGLTKYCMTTFAFVAPHHLFAGTATTGIHRSTDGGDTWSAVNAGMTSTAIWCVVPLADGSILTGTSRGMFRSTSQGERWSRIARDSSSTIYSIVQTADGSILISTEKGLHRSTDNGATWAVITTGLMGEAVFQIARGTGQDLYIVGQERIARSTDNGSTWSLCAPIPPTYLTSVAVAQDGTVFVGSYSGVYRSTDGGTSWAQMR